MVEVSKWLLVWPLAKAKRNDFLLQNESISKVSLNNRNCHCDTRISEKGISIKYWQNITTPYFFSNSMRPERIKGREEIISASIWVRFRGKILIQCHKIVVRFSFAAWVIKENCYCFYKLWSFEGSHTCAWLRTFRYIKDFLPDKSWVPTRGLISLMQAYHRINNLRWVIDFCLIESNW